MFVLAHKEQTLDINMQFLSLRRYVFSCTVLVAVLVIIPTSLAAAFELKLKLRGDVTTALTLVLSQAMEETTADTVSTAGETVAVINDFALPLDFLYELALSFIFTDQHFLLLSWEVTAANQQALLQTTEASSAIAVVGQRYYGARELKNQVLLEYLMQPLPVLWIGSYLEYHTLSETSGEQFNFTESFFTYHAYRVGMNLGMHKETRYLERRHDRSQRVTNFMGWSSTLGFSYEAYYFLNDKLPQLELNIAADSTLGNQEQLIVSLPSALSDQLLNYRAVKANIVTSFKAKELIIRAGYAYELDFLANELLLPSEQLVAGEAVAFSNAPGMFALQSLYIEFKFLVNEREQNDWGLSGVHWVELVFAYVFETRSYTENSLRVGYAESPGLLYHVNRLATFTVNDHQLALYVNSDDEHYQHLVKLSPRVNFMPRRAFNFYYDWLLIDYSEYVPPSGTERNLSSQRTLERLDQWHHLRFGFKFFDLEGLRLVEPYFGIVIAHSNDSLQAFAFEESYSLGFTLSYQF